MAKIQLILLLAASFVMNTIQTSTPSSPFYTAGVVEFQKASSLVSSIQQLENNLASYIEIITSQEAYETDIIVFPEATLNSVLHTTYVPDPIHNIAPCNDSLYAKFLQKLSCTAKTSQKYIVINLSEKENCTKTLQEDNHDPRPCSKDGLNIFNTNVVFDRNGTVISRYRKFNLYYEPVNTTLKAEHGQFSTDFGVKFGHFICFDMLFYSPTTELVKSNITDFIFTTMWFSELPFLTAVQYQQSWAYSYDVNLLASGASNPAVGNTGSGIYSGRKGSIVSVMNSSPERKLYVARVPKKGFIGSDDIPVPQVQIRKKRATTSYMKNLLVKRDSRIDSFNTVPLNISTEKTTFCDKDLCCNFNLNITLLEKTKNSESYKYRLAAFDGNRIYPGIQPLGWSVCSIMACINDTLEGCALAFDENVTVSPEIRFQSIEIEANFTKTENNLLMPNSVDDDLMPLQVNSFYFNVTDIGSTQKAHLRLLTPKDDLIQFGIYVNYFRERSASSLVHSCSVLILLCSSFLTYPFFLKL